MFLPISPTSPAMGSFNASNTLGILQELASSVAHASQGELLPMSNGGTAHVLREPYGVCLSMAPWNAPLLLACRAIATPIIAGNTVVFKTSEISPATHLLFGDLFRDAGLPDGVLNILHVAPKDAPATVERLISDPRIKHINFTGSTKIGSVIGALAGKYIKPVILELGGKAPAIVLADADLDIASSNVILGAWMHQGQICMSTEKAIVHSDVYDSFVEKCKAVGSSSQIRHAPLGQAMPSGATRASGLIDEAIQNGAKLLLGPNNNEGTTLTPCILTDVTPSMRIYSEETFSPIFLIIKANTDEEAIELANDTSYGLSSAIFSKDVYRATELAKRLDAAATHINSLTVSDDPAVPHGGNKMSGHGRFNGVHGIRSFLQTKVITVHGQGHSVPV